DRLLRFAEFRLMDGGEGRGESRFLRAVDNRLARKHGSEVLVADLARQQQQCQDAETEGALQATLRPIAPCNHPGSPPPCKTQSIFPPAQGDVMAQMRRIFYCRSKLAILLIGRQIATMSPQAVHGEAALAARSVSSRSPRRQIGRRRKSPAPRSGQKRDHRLPTIHRNATGTVPIIGTGRKWHRVSPAARRWHHIFTPCSAKYFSAPGCHGMGEFFID